MSTVTTAVSVTVALAFVLIAIVYVVTGRRYRGLRADYQANHDLGTGPQLDPYELALLAGGKRRMGELVLTHLYINGWTRVTSRARPLLGSPPQIEATPQVSERTGSEHPVTAAAVRALVSGKPTRPGLVAEAAIEGAWTADALERLRDAGLLMRPEQLRNIRGVRRAAVAIHVVPPALLSVVVTFFSGFTILTSVTFGWSVGAGAPLPIVAVVWVLAFGLALVVLVRAYARFGVRVLIGATAVMALLMLLVDVLPTVASVALLSFCAVWFAVYGIYAITGKSLGPRTPRGDAVLAEARERVAASADHQDVERTVSTVALRGPAAVMSRRRDVAWSAVALQHADELKVFYIEIGIRGSPVGGSHGDGGDGGGFDGDGGSGGLGGGFGGGIDAGGGGDGGGGSGGGGAGGGGD